MTCQSHRQALLELARGVADVGAGEAEAHVRACASCAAYLRRQRDLTAAVQALSADARNWTASSGVEKRLADAFATEQAVRPASTGHRVPDWRHALSTAAAVVIFMLAAAWWSNPTIAPGVQLAPHSEPAGDAARPQPPGHGLEQVAAIEFVMIPAAAGLPPLESARIIRMEVPVSALPDYGLQVVSDGRRAAVEADLLVGQDGLARGIRLLPSQLAQDSSSIHRGIDRRSRQ
jgi:hypothetical protein